MSFTFHASKMSFYRITDPKKRDAMVKDYVSTLKRLHKRELSERLGELSYQHEQERQYKPLIKSHEELMQHLRTDKNEAIVPEKEAVKKEHGPLTAEIKRKILARDPDVDTTFGIYFSQSGDAFMGSRAVTIQDDDIVIGNEVYHGTDGLWRLIMGVREDQIGNIGVDFTEGDLQEYVKLLRQTNVLHRNFDPNNTHPRSSTSWKWKYILKPLWYKFKKEEDSEEDGSGVKFLPGTIKALRGRLDLLLGEYRAGNTTTRNEIVAVLDQLRSRKAISEDEYRALNSSL